MVKIYQQYGQFLDFWGMSAKKAGSGPMSHKKNPDTQ